MLEHRRHQYLSLLGIENYMPTRILPSAAPSVIIPDELLVDPAALPIAPLTLEPAINNSEATDESTKRVVIDEPKELGHALVDNGAVADVTSITSPLDTLGGQAKDESIEPVQAQEIRSNINESVQEGSSALVSIKFIFSVWRIKDVLVLDTRKVREALPTDRLLQNILRAVGYSIAQLPASESLRWPLFENKRFTNARKSLSDATLSEEHYKADKEQARAMVQAYITAQHTKAPLKYLFLMGEEASVFTLDEATGVDNSIGSMSTATLWDGIQCFTMPSLYTMLQDPPSKRIAWEALQLMNNDHE